MFKTDVYFNTNHNESDYWLRNANFLRCDNITLGYTFDNLLREKLRLRLFAAVQNPFVINSIVTISSLARSFSARVRHYMTIYIPAA